MRIARLLSVIALTGCDHITLIPTSLADFPGLQPSVLMYSSGDAGSVHTQVQVGLAYQAGQFRDGVDECADVDDSFRATLNGAAMTVHPPGYDHDAALCSGPMVDITVTPELRASVSQIELADDSKTIVIDLGDALVERTVTRVGGTQWSFHVGDQVTVQWAPASDVGTFAPLISYTAPTSDFAAWRIDRGSITASGDQLTFTIPAGGPPTGTLEFDMYPSPDDPLVPCGDVECELFLTRTVMVSAAISP